LKLNSSTSQIKLSASLSARQCYQTLSSVAPVLLLSNVSLEPFELLVIVILGQNVNNWIARSARCKWLQCS